MNYKEILKGIVNIINTAEKSDIGFANICTYIGENCPELDVSEDELTWLTRFIKEEAYSLSMDIRDNEDRVKLKKLQRSLAWLEKQGDLTIRFFTDEFELALGRIIAFWNQNHKDGKYDENELMSYIKVRETELVKLFTDNVCKVSLSDCSEEYRKAYYDGYNKCNRDWFKIKDISVDEYNKNAEILLGGKVKQKSVDNLEPKFKKGDWCIDDEDGTIFQIVKVLDNTYIYKTNEGSEYSCTHYSLENDAKLWTIADAKDGDVLVTDFEEDNMILMYHSMCTIDTINVHCCLDNKFTCANLGVFDVEDVKPATKEQRALLFSKMKDAGYEFDFDKKELKKIEKQVPKTKWTKEDEMALNDALWCCKQASSIAKDENDMGNAWYAETWLKSLKKRLEVEE